MMTRSRTTLAKAINSKEDTRKIWKETENSRDDNRFLKKRRELEEKSAVLDKFLKRRSWLRFSENVVIILFVLISALFSYNLPLDFLEHIDPISSIMFLVLIALFFLSLQLPKFELKISERKRISYCLSIIARSIRGDYLDKKYVRFLYQESDYDESEEIKDQDYILEKYQTKFAVFWENLREFALKLNHAASCDNLQGINQEAISLMAIAIYDQKEYLVELSKLLAESYEETLAFSKFAEVISKWEKSLLVKMLILAGALASIISIILYLRVIV